MKKVYKNILLLISVFGLIISNATITQAAGTQSLKNIIEVSGQATIKVKPNVAYITASVRTEDKNAKIAGQENAKIIEKIKKDIISKYNLSDTDIRTNYYTISPSYDYIDGKQTFRAYIVEHSLEITATNMEKVGEIVDTLVGSGATSVNNIRFAIIDSDATYNLALQKAIENAKSKANAITAAIGVSESKPIAIVEQGGSTGVVERIMNKEAADGIQLAGVPTSIMQNEIEIIATVLVRFQY